jgi:hypothetical protein
MKQVLKVGRKQAATDPTGQVGIFPVDSLMCFVFPVFKFCHSDRPFNSPVHIGCILNNCGSESR